MAEVISEERIAQAWASTFSGHGGREDAEIVLWELRVITGFYLVTRQDAPDGVRAYNDGCRSVYAHLVRRLVTDSAAFAVEREARAFRVEQKQGTKTK